MFKIFFIIFFFDEGFVKLVFKVKKDNEFWDFYDKGGKNL